MPVNIDKMKKDRERHEGGILWNPPEGDSLFYVCPPAEGVDLPYVETGVHWNVGRSKARVVCLDKNRNPALNNPLVLKWIKKLGINVDGGCPICEHITENDLWETDREQARSINYNPRFWWLIITMFFRRNAKEDWGEVSEAQRKVRPWVSGKQQWDDVSEVFYDEGDITDPSGAVLIKLSRDGRGLKTQYSIAADSKTLKSPMSLPKALHGAVRKALAGEELDLHHLCAAEFKPRDELESLMRGISVESPDAGEPDASGTKECFGDGDLYDPGDDECKSCEHFKDCGAAISGASSGDDSSGGDSEPEPEPEPEPAKTPTKAELAAAKRRKSAPADKDENLEQLDKLLDERSKGGKRAKAS